MLFGKMGVVNLPAMALYNSLFLKLLVKGAEESSPKEKEKRKKKAVYEMKQKCIHYNFDVYAKLVYVNSVLPEVNRQKL